MTDRERQIAKDLILYSLFMFGGKPVNEFLDVVEEVIQETFPSGADTSVEQLVPPHPAGNQDASAE